MSTIRRRFRENDNCGFQHKKTCSLEAVDKPY
jgi:hypothetical protein